MQNIAAESYSITITFVSVKVPTYFLPFYIYPRTSQHKTCAHYQKFNQPPSFQVKCTILPANGVVLWGWNRIQGNCANTFREKIYCNATKVHISVTRNFCFAPYKCRKMPYSFDYVLLRMCVLLSHNQWFKRAYWGNVCT